MLKPIQRKIALVLALFSIIYISLSFQLPSYPYAPVDADAIPKTLGFLLLLLAVCLFFSKKIETEMERQKRTFPKKDLYILLGVCAFILMYIFLLEIIGFVIMTTLFIFFCSWFLGYKNFKVNSIVSIGFSITLYFLFSYLLQINLPSGILPV
ncbi:tripartite tricarboxylate transporter TctB family protein [Litchfieldia salsa]|uniref:Putative tricarboxylic transport membrane protein n=1 Tax=Litchfieldia salsa TaxID=930152 RepID=A0A1H0Q4S2_9BACI|nr:tripartite tricarboxylate transporter TctB family protein [Litchfieldia salsa]SDP11609.1 putative tricarboxylic transport membrane protein [Litchfieldia salsa]